MRGTRAERAEQRQVLSGFRQSGASRHAIFVQIRPSPTFGQIIGHRNSCQTKSPPFGLEKEVARWSAKHEEGMPLDKTIPDGPVATDKILVH
jgi:hypothetical protein